MLEWQSASHAAIAEKAQRTTLLCGCRKDPSKMKVFVKLRNLGSSRVNKACCNRSSCAGGGAVAPAQVLVQPAGHYGLLEVGVVQVSVRPPRPSRRRWGRLRGCAVPSCLGAAGFGLGPRPGRGRGRRHRRVLRAWVSSRWDPGAAPCRCPAPGAGRPGRGR